MSFSLLYYNEEEYEENIKVRETISFGQFLLKRDLKYQLRSLVLSEKAQEIHDIAPMFLLFSPLILFVFHNILILLLDSFFFHMFFKHLVTFSFSFSIFF